MAELNIGDQVTVRESQRSAMSSHSVTVVRLGTILAFSADKTKADVSISSVNPSISRSGSNRLMQDVSKTRRWIPVKELQASTDRFGGRKVVQVNPTSRGIASLIR